jgi:hypothetical protein
MIGEAEAFVGFDRRREERELVGSAGDGEGAGGRKQVSMFSWIRDVADLIDGGLEGEEDAAGGVCAPAAGHGGGGDGEARGAPAAVASGGAVAGDLALDDGDFEAGVVAEEVIGGPEAGVAGAEDRDVDLLRALEGWARGERIAGVFEPEAQVLAVSEWVDSGIASSGQQPACGEGEGDAQAFAAGDLSWSSRMLRTMVTTGIERRERDDRRWRLCPFRRQRRRRGSRRS